jgi:phenylacetate-CoA ligase
MDGALQNFCTELGLSDLVEFMGHIPYGELPMQYAWAHLYLHSSLHEGQSVSVVEAMASGVPVCGTRVGILADLENVCVRCVPPGEHVGLARTASDVLADSEQYERMARAGLEWAGDHTLAWTANGLREVYHAFGKPNAELTGGVR